MHLLSPKQSPEGRRRVRWTRGEVVSAVLLALVLAAETICIALWLMGHTFD
jgi:hypothetical protein